MSRAQIRFSSAHLLQQTVVALAYALLAYPNLHYFPFQKYLAIPQLASGFALSVLLLRGREYAAGVFLGALTASILAGATDSATLAYAAGAVFQALAGFYLIDFYNKKNNLKICLETVESYFFFIIAVGIFASLVRPLLVCLVLFAAGHVSQEAIMIRFMTLWLGEAVGCVVMLPLILSAVNGSWSLLPMRKLVQAVILFVICFATGQLVFFGWYQTELGEIVRPYWMILFISWIAIAFGARLVSLAIVLLMVQSFWGTMDGMGFFGQDVVLTNLIRYCFYILIICFLGMSLGSYVNEQIRHKDALLLKLNDLQLREQALDAISQGVVIADTDRRITYVNRAFSDMSGYPPEEVLGGPCSVLQGPDSDKETIAIITEALNSQMPFHGEILSYKKDRSSFWNEIAMSPVKDAHGKLVQFVSVQHDISPRKLAESQAILAKAVFDNNPNGILVTDAEQRIVMVNAKFVSVTGYEPSEMIGKNPRMLSSGKQDQAFYMEMWHKIHADKKWEGEIWNCRKNGEMYPEWLAITPVCNQDGEVSNYIGMFTDLSVHKKAEEDIDRLINFDVLTGLPNLAFMQNQGERALEYARLNQASVALLFLDLDHFKFVNDTMGHHVGDLLLIEVSRRFQRLLREGDVLSRQGGDEFVVLLPGASEKGASYVAKKILAAIKDSFQIEQRTINISVSIGVALYPKDGQNFEDLSKCADTALFHAKEHGRSSFQIYDSQMSNEVLERVRLENALHLAVSNEEFDIHYQALTDLQSGKITGFEALLRWQHAELGQVSPARFIPIAEECGLINAIGAWVLNRVCQDIRGWLDKGIAAPQVAVNFSPRQFRSANLITHIQEALVSYQLPSSALCIEITEGVLMEDAHVSQIALTELKQLGITLSLDDFGTGYSSLSYLKLFPFDKVKIDKSFVCEITSGSQDAAIVIAIIGMAHSLGIKVLAEGVETEAQCEFLRNNMADEIQGYLFSKPIPAADAEALLLENRQLGQHLLRLSRPEKTLLLVDDEQNIVSSLKRLLRKDGYHILTANSGQEGLDILTDNTVDVIVSDQRMPGMTGVEFLRKVKGLYPDTIRIVLSGYTELNSVTDAINEGAVFRFLTKPWDDDKLREHIKEAFHYKALADDNRRLSLKVQTSNQELASANRQLANMLQEKQQQIIRNSANLEIVREALQYTPVAVIGLDDANVIAFVNDAALGLFAVGSILGEELGLVLPEVDAAISQAEEGAEIPFVISQNHYSIRWRQMGELSQSNGKIVIFAKDNST